MQLRVAALTVLLLAPLTAATQEPAPPQPAPQEPAVPAPAPTEPAAQEQVPPEPPNRAQQIFDDVIEALGGETYLNVRDMFREGRLYDFDRGELASPGTQFKNYLKFPNKEWMEYGKKGNIVYLNNGDQGWELDRQGINDQTPEAVENWKETNLRDPEYLLRFRVRGEKLPLYYLGTEFVDNRMVHILEIVDTDGESLKLYVDTNTYLPMQLHYSRYNPLRRGRNAYVEYYGKYIEIDGVQTPMQISRLRDGERVLEVFLSEVKLNENLNDSFFTRENLEERWQKVK